MTSYPLAFLIVAFIFGILAACGVPSGRFNLFAISWVFFLAALLFGGVSVLR